MKERGRSFNPQPLRALIMVVEIVLDVPSHR
jgi:hypothetical protein